MIETVLSVLPGVSAHDRVTLVHRSTSSGSSVLVLRKESWGEKVGWFDQGSVELSPDQVRDLRSSLGVESKGCERPLVGSNATVLKFPA